MAFRTKKVQQDLDFDISVKYCPATQHRQPATHLGSHLTKPNIPRANLAVTREFPHGSEDSRRRYQDYTTLQQHVLFWDRDGDGKINTWDTYVGFRDLGFNILISVLAVIIINGTLSYPTRLASSWLPDPFFRIFLSGIHKSKHGSDTGVFDTEGRFNPQMFENIFSKHNTNGDGTLTLRELFDVMHTRRCAIDPFGWAAALFEWIITWLLIQKDGKIYKEDLRQIYDVRKLPTYLLNIGER
ncbi:hypothetical protein LOZ61_000625 [Ophidiomyces ophidiicola]|nr:hypothetical protein LOZ61_000625 [Ophidiomyces ophidiicola]KAI1927697.1 hypothetical protein LOZ60_002956 [Ophidiomyces ophidiicola]KAI1965612.1 hypothetical protein LOZ59_001170 [Ophidiomyces ophidiicola]KAI1972767.1 hypothetical protein LOZ56_002286 [Ophidiomyces ophidiicola]KAI2013539.1 hypothetical protein LOZ49_001974 [Ophidiomyces ophidiicola]